jgi:holo-[acyl-carrier protein] synthase
VGVKLIYGIGTDIVEVARLENSIQQFGDEFAARVLAESEMENYQQTKLKARFLAKRFAAKEAFSKALGTGIRGVVSFQNIAVSHDELGKPLLILAQDLADFVHEKRITQMHVSISDEKNLATAFVVLESQ